MSFVMSNQFNDDTETPEQGERPFRWKSLANSSEAFSDDTLPSPSVGIFAAPGSTAATVENTIYEGLQALGSFTKGVVTSTLGLPGDLESLVRAGINKIPGSEKGRRFSKPGENLQSVLPSSSEINSKLAQLTGGQTEASSPLQEFTEDIGSFAGPLLLGALTGGASAVGGALLAGTGAAVGKRAGGAIGEAIGQRVEAPEKGRVVGEVVGSLGGGLSALKRGGKARISNKADLAVIEGAQAAEDLGLVTSSIGLTKPKAMQSISQYINNGFVKRPEFQNMMSEIGKNMNDKLRASLTRLSGETFASSLEAGEQAVDFIKASMNAQKGVNADIWQRATDAIGSTAIDASDSIQFIKSNLKQFRKSPIRGPDRTKAIEQLEKLEGVLSAHQETGGVPADILMETRKAINEIVDLDVRGGIKQSLLKTNGVLNGDLQKGLKFHGKEEALSLYRQANESHKTFSDRFRNDMMAAILNGDNPESLVKRMGSRVGINKVKEALGSSPEGKEMFNSLARHVVENKLASVFPLDSEVADISKLSKLMLEGGDADVIKALLPKDTFRDLSRLQKMSKGITAGMRKFGMPSSGLEGSALDNTRGAMIYSLATGRWDGLANLVGFNMMQKLAASQLTNEKFRKAVQQAALAGQSGNKQQWMKAWTTIYPIVDRDLQDVSQAYNFPQAELQRVRFQTAEGRGETI